MPLPARSTIADFDGDNKINYATIPPANQATDWDNTKLAPGISDVVALGLTGCRFWCRVVLNTTTGGMSIPTWYANWTNVTSTAPVPSRVGTGNYTITLPSMVSDEYDASVGTTNNITVNLVAASGTLEGSNFGFISCSASGNAINIYTATAAGSTPADFTAVTALIVAR